jgi:type IV pilus assembly protein PilA
MEELVRTSGPKAQCGDRGFTLIELMVVVLIIAILIAIAIPTFLGARTRAQDRSAHTDLRNGLTTANVVYTDFSSYSFDGADLASIESALAFDDDIALSTTSVIGYRVEHVNGTDSQIITLAKQSNSDTWFCISQQNITSGGDTAGVYYGQGAALADVDTHAECTSGWSPTP